MATGMGIARRRPTTPSSTSQLGSMWFSSYPQVVVPYGMVCDDLDASLDPHGIPCDKLDASFDPHCILCDELDVSMDTPCFPTRHIPTQPIHVHPAHNTPPLYTTHACASPHTAILHSWYFNPILSNFCKIQVNPNQLNSNQFNSIQFNSIQFNSIQFNSIQSN